MNDRSETNYFKIGAFVLVGLGLIIFALLILGSDKLFQRVVYAETYFDESVQGISIGTPVKYRGLRIGYIKDIAFTSEKYGNEKDPNMPMHNRSIYVKIAITSKLFTDLAHKECIELLTREVRAGLRVKLVAQGITGISYLELDYIGDAATIQPFNLAWRPHDFYIPAAKSTLTRLSENAQDIMSKLKDIDFKKLFQDASSLVSSMVRITSKIEVLLGRTDDNDLPNILQNLKIISDNMRGITGQLKLNPSEMIFSKPLPRLDLSKL